MAKKTLRTAIEDILERLEFESANQVALLRLLIAKGLITPADFKTYAEKAKSDMSETWLRLRTALFDQL